MNTWKERVQEEINGLELRIDKLRLFIIGPDLRILPPTQVALLHLQYNAMVQYLNILQLRLSL
jgi:hypothetical protein